MDPTTPIHRQLSRDERLQIQTLRAFAKLSYEEITQCLGFTLCQVQLACRSNRPTWIKVHTVVASCHEAKL